jgi:hypothetical protein
MPGRIVGALLPVAAFFGVAGLASADLCTFNYPGQGQLASEVCGNDTFLTSNASVAPPNQFTLPQFSPALGQLQLNTILPPSPRRSRRFFCDGSGASRLDGDAIPASQGLTEPVNRNDSCCGSM